MGRFRIFLFVCGALAAASLFAAELYDNGPLVTHPGQGFNGADVSAIQTAMGANIAGYGVQLTGGNRLADDFIVPTGGWRLDAVTLFAFQNNSGTQSTITDVRLQIWNGPPDNANSQVVFGDLAANRLISSAWTGIYRAPDTNLAANNRPVMQCVVRIETFLPPGTYWLDWTIGGTLTNGPWAPPVTRLGLPGTGNALQFFASTQTWMRAIDNGAGAWPDDLPFVLNGNTGSTATVLPSSMSVGPGIILSGNLDSLLTSDDNRLILRPGIIFSSGQRPISVILEGVAPGTSATELRAVIESHAGIPNINQRIEAFDFNANGYVIVDSRNLPTADLLLNIGLANPQRFIGPGNVLRMRLSYAAAGPVFVYPWQVRIDEATWRFSP